MKQSATNTKSDEVSSRAERDAAVTITTVADLDAALRARFGDDQHDPRKAPMSVAWAMALNGVAVNVKDIVATMFGDIRAELLVLGAAASSIDRVGGAAVSGEDIESVAVAISRRIDLLQLLVERA